MNIDSFPIETLNYILCKSVEADSTLSYEDGFKQSCALLGKISLVCSNWLDICTSISVSSPSAHVYKLFLQSEPTPQPHFLSLRSFLQWDCHSRFSAAIRFDCDVAISRLSIEKVSLYDMFVWQSKEGVTNEVTIAQQIIEKNSVSALKRFLDNKDIRLESDPEQNLLNIFEEYFWKLMIENPSGSQVKNDPLFQLLQSDPRVYKKEINRWDLLGSKSAKLLWDRCISVNSQNTLEVKHHNYWQWMTRFPTQVYLDGYYLTLIATSSFENIKPLDQERLIRRWREMIPRFDGMTLLTLVKYSSKIFLFESTYNAARLLFPESTRKLENSLLFYYFRNLHNLSEENALIILQNFIGLSLEERLAWKETDQIELYIAALNLKHKFGQNCDRIIDMLVPYNEEMHSATYLERLEFLMKNYLKLQDCIDAIKGKGFISSRLQSSNESDEEFEPDNMAVDSPFARFPIIEKQDESSSDDESDQPPTKRQKTSDKWSKESSSQLQNTSL